MHQGSVKGFILVETDDSTVIYEHTAEWAEQLDWKTTPVFTDAEAGPLIGSSIVKQCPKVRG